MKSLLSKGALVVISVTLLTLCILMAKGNGDSIIEPETVMASAPQTTDDQPSISKAVPNLEEAAISSPLPIPSEVLSGNISTSTPLPTEADDEERAEEIVEEPIRENILYYVMDSGYRYDCDIAYQDYLWQKCVEYEIQDYYELLLAMMYHESKFDPSIVSGTNDYGLFQINVCNHSWLKETLGISDFLDPYDSIDAGVHIISGYLKKYNDVHMALMCYNMGEGGAKRSGATSSRYSRGVVADMDKLQLLEEQ